MRKKLTATSVNRLPVPASGQKEYPDPDLPGFALRVTSKGVRSFVLHYRPKSGSHKGKLTRWTIGRLGELSLAEARRLARDARIAVRDQGADPARDSRHSEPEDGPETYQKAVEDYHAKYQVGKKGNRTADTTKRLLMNGGATWLHKPVADITRQEIHDVLDRIMAEQKPYLANRTHAAFRTFFRWCAARDKIAFSPCGGRHYSDQEIKALWHGVDKLGPHRAAFVKLAILLGKRRGELAGLTWDELDLAEGFWILPASRSKNNLRHKMPLPALAVRILKSLPRIQGNPLVFPSRKTGRPMNGWNKFQLAVEGACKPEDNEKSQVEGFTFHACRHTLKTRLGALGIPPHVKDKVLHHAPPKTAGEAYDHYDYEREQREALEAWADHVKGNVWPDGVEVLRG
jgi:integrase